MQRGSARLHDVAASGWCQSKSPGTVNARSAAAIYDAGQTRFADEYF